MEMEAEENDGKLGKWWRTRVEEMLEFVPFVVKFRQGESSGTVGVPEARRKYHYEVPLSSTACRKHEGTTARRE